MPDEDERWMKLCQQASTEQNPEKLLELVKEINELLDSKNKRRVNPLTSPSDDGNSSTSPSNLPDAG
jgi:hypothetical protein